MTQEKVPCPFCQEPIHSLATKCRHCKEFLPENWSAVGQPDAGGGKTGAGTEAVGPAPPAAPGAPLQRPAVTTPESRLHPDVTARPDAPGGVFRGLAWMLGISVVLFFLPVLGPFVGGLVGGKKSGSILNGILAALVPALVMANLALMLSAVLIDLPLLGALLTAGAGIIALLNAGPLLVGAIIGGLLADNVQEPVSRSGLMVVVGGSAVLVVGMVLQIRTGISRLPRSVLEGQLSAPPSSPEPLPLNVERVSDDRMTIVRSDLKNLVTAQESFFADSNRYAGSLAEITRARLFSPTSDVAITVLGGSATGFAARGTRRSDTGMGCAVFVGSAYRLAGLRVEGEVLCSRALATVTLTPARQSPTAATGVAPPPESGPAPKEGRAMADPATSARPVAVLGQETQVVARTAQRHGYAVRVRLDSVTPSSDGLRANLSAVNLTGNTLYYHLYHRSPFGAGKADTWTMVDGGGRSVGWKRVVGIDEYQPYSSSPERAACLLLPPSTSVTFALEFPLSQRTERVTLAHTATRDLLFMATCPGTPVAFPDFALSTEITAARRTAQDPGVAQGGVADTIVNAVRESGSMSPKVVIALGRAGARRADDDTIPLDSTPKGVGSTIAFAVGIPFNDMAGSMALALGAGDVRHLAYRTREGFVHYAVKRDGRWSKAQRIELLSVQQPSDDPLAITVTEGGAPIVAFKGIGVREVRIATLAPRSGWRTETAAQNNDVGKAMAVVSTQEGRIHVAYRGVRGPVHYVVGAPGRWIAGNPVDTREMNPSGRLAIALLDNRPLVAYQGPSRGELVAATQSDGGWLLEGTVLAGQGGDPLALAIDPVARRILLLFQDQEARVSMTVRHAGSWSLTRLLHTARSTGIVSATMRAER